MRQNRTGIILTAAYGATLMLLSGAANAANVTPLYFDNNGATSGLTTAGTWSASGTNWSTAAAGNVTTGAWVPGDTATFGAAGTVTLADTESIGGIAFTSGAVTIGAAANNTLAVLSIGSNNVAITNSTSSTQSILDPITGSGNINYNYSGTGGGVSLNLTGSMSGFTGSLYIGPGTSQTLLSQVQLDSSFGTSTTPANTINLSNYSLLSDNNTVTTGLPAPNANVFTLYNNINLNYDNAVTKAESWISASNGTGGQKIETYAGVISGASDVTFGIGNGGGRGTVVLGANNTYTGNTFITLANTNGLLQLGVDNAIPATSSLTFGPNPALGTVSSPAIAPLDLNGHNLSLTGLSTSTTNTTNTGVGNIYNLGTSGSTITITGSGSTTYKGDIGDTNLNTNPFNDNAPYFVAGSYAVTASTNVSVTLNGQGSLTLAPVLALANGNEYTGNTTVNSGTLVLGRVNANQQASSNYTLVNSNIVVNSGGTLSTVAAAATGYVGGTGGTITLNSGSTFTPGGVGTTAVLSTNSLVTNSGAILNFDVNSLSSFDQIILAGNLTLDSAGTHAVNITTTNSNLTAGTYPLIETGGISWDGTNGFSLGTIPSSANGDTYSIGINGNNVDLVVTAPALRWDPNGNGTPITEGGGTWTDGVSTFLNLANNTETTWNNAGSNAVIIGSDASQTGGTITLGSSIVTGGLLTFGPIYPGYGYTVSDGGNSVYTLTTATGIVANASATLDANVLLNGNQTWQVDSGQTLTLTHGLNQSTPSILTASGPGTIAINGPAGNISGLQISGGTVALGAVDSIGSAAITINGGNLGLGASATYLNNITFGSNGGGIGPYGGASATLSGNLSSATAVNISGSGTLTLTGTNSFPALNLTSATLAVSSSAALGGAQINFSGGGLTVSGVSTLSNNLSLRASGTTGNGDQLNFGAGPLTLTGAISGSGDLHVYGSGTLTLAGSNTFSGGAFYIENPITVSVTNPAGLSTGTIAVDAAATLDIETNVNSGPIRGSAVWAKTGPGTLTLSGSSPTAPAQGLGVVIQQGNIQLNSITGLGGANNTTNSASAPQAAITIDSGTQLLINTQGQRASGNITLAGGSIIRTSTAPTGDFAFTVLSVDVGAATSFVYNYTNNVSPALTVTASSLIDNNEQASAGQTQDLMITEPVVVNTGTKLTLQADNTAGNYEQAAVILRGVTNNTLDPYDNVTLQAGSAIVATGPGDIDFGGTGRGIPILAEGTPGSDALLQFGSHSFIRDTGTATQNQGATDTTRLIIDGSGSAGLRIEAPMNATYTVPNPTGAPALRTYDGTTGLFGINTTATAVGGTLPTGYSTVGNGFTVLSPSRAAGLSNTYQLPSGQVITPAGTLTLAATDPGGATGIVNAGPAQPSNVSLALDNTATSGNLVYQIDPAGNGGTFANFAGLTVERSNPTAGTVTAQLLGNTIIPSLTISGATVDVTSHNLVVSQGSLATITAQVQSGFNQGNWNGSTGILSTAAASDPTHLTAVGVLLNDDGTGNPLYGSGAVLGQFGGLNPALDAVLVKYTYYGDSNLDGVVDSGDYSRIDNGYLTHLTGWSNGDFNYDGVVNGSDYTLIDNAFNTQGASLAGQIAASTAQVASSGVSAVPEPATVSLLGIGATALLGRRRRRLP